MCVRYRPFRRKQGANPPPRQRRDAGGMVEKVIRNACDAACNNFSPQKTCSTGIANAAASSERCTPSEKTTTETSPPNESFTEPIDNLPAGNGSGCSVKNRPSIRYRARTDSPKTSETLRAPAQSTPKSKPNRTTNFLIVSLLISLQPNNCLSTAKVTKKISRTTIFNSLSTKKHRFDENFGF